MIFLIGIVVAVSLSNVKDVVIPAKDTTFTGLKGELTFLRDGVLSSCYIKEPDGKIDFRDVEFCVGRGEITEITDWNGNRFKEGINQTTGNIEYFWEKK